MGLAEKMDSYLEACERMQALIDELEMVSEKKEAPEELRKARGHYEKIRQENIRQYGYSTKVLPNGPQHQIRFVPID